MSRLTVAETLVILPRNPRPAAESRTNIQE